MFLRMRDEKRQHPGSSSPCQASNMAAPTSTSSYVATATCGSAEYIYLTGYKAIPIQTKREALRKFYLFEQSWEEKKPEGVDWNLYPDLLDFLQSL
jgi:hypothetical protein